ncbi:MAG: Txe/YoeB family addiction module toxin [Candidatus Amulumruptor caecigallinarius]|nr:Txe/YoeB family addiction module toxin [Candidatus Amulumruptor caecigallinarius]MCM1395953.1 Txe/YoeB family addiction module toxin [Candidatus Amulumruptor caecigallinarius]MCM1452988.1 Txe/YoeB family addiction module toxin [bacterium]
MSYSIDYSKQTEKVLRKWKKSNPIAFTKFKSLLKELGEHPRTGTGHPEPLVGRGDITWSRHITKNDRMIYDIYDDVVSILIVEIEGHYDDK